MRYVSGECRTSNLRGREGHWRDLQEGVERVSGHNNGGANPASRWNHGLLMKVKKIHLGGDLPPCPKRRQIPFGDGTAVVEFRGVLH